MSDADALKRAAAAEALERVEDGMRLGLGTGSTVAFFLDLLAERMADGGLADVVGVATSEWTETRCRELGIPLGSLHGTAPLDLTVDGADEVDPALDLIKGMGGALLREKMVATASRRMVVIADESKDVPRLGSRSPLPLEVVAFEWQVHVPFLEDLGARPELRSGPDGAPYRTDNGNVLLECRFPGGIEDPVGLDEALSRRPGVVETGLFLGVATEAILAGPGGVVSRGQGGRA